jgi:hypothetical protein
MSINFYKSPKAIVLLLIIALSGCTQKYVSEVVDLRNLKLYEYLNFTDEKKIDVSKEYIRAFSYEGRLIKSFSNNLKDDAYLHNMANLIHSGIGGDDPSFSQKLVWDEVEEVVDNLAWTIRWSN